MLQQAALPNGVDPGRWPLRVYQAWRRRVFGGDGTSESPETDKQFIPSECDAARRSEIRPERDVPCVCCALAGVGVPGLAASGDPCEQTQDPKRMSGQERRLRFDGIACRSGGL